jgi:hypothetical protein
VFRNSLVLILTKRLSQTGLEMGDPCELRNEERARMGAIRLVTVTMLFLQPLGCRFHDIRELLDVCGADLEVFRPEG